VQTVSGDAGSSSGFPSNAPVHSNFSSAHFSEDDLLIRHSDACSSSQEEDEDIDGPQLCIDYMCVQCIQH
jgi:hypothetical protein